MLRARCAEHFFIDGTFDIAPYGYSQVLTIMTNDIVVNYPKPLAYILLTSKDEEAYTLCFDHYRNFSNIRCSTF